MSTAQALLVDLLELAAERIDLVHRRADLRFHVRLGLGQVRSRLPEAPGYTIRTSQHRLACTRVIRVRAPLRQAAVSVVERTSDSAVVRNREDGLEGGQAGRLLITSPPCLYLAADLRLGVFIARALYFPGCYPTHVPLRRIEREGLETGALPGVTRRGGVGHVVTRDFESLVENIQGAGGNVQRGEEVGHVSSCQRESVTYGEIRSDTPGGIPRAQARPEAAPAQVKRGRGIQQ